MKITVVGTGYVGLVTGTCLAETGNEVLCVDIDQAKVDLMRGGEVQSMSRISTCFLSVTLRQVA